jgi:hypothetical protein
MKPTKGLFLDTRPLEQPEGTYPYGKNGIQYDKQGSLYNEPGFRKLVSMVVPYHFNGCIETDTYPIVFSTDNVSSAIGFLNMDTEQYQPIIDDATWNVVNPDGTRARIGFKTANYITGQAQKNYKAERVCVFTDKTIFPMYLNCDNPNIKTLDDLRLFAVFNTPEIDVNVGSGGSVPAGAYYVAIGYEKKDGTSTQYSKVSNVTIVTSGSIAGTADKVLNISVSNVDQNYDFMRVAIISKINGVINTIELTDYQPVTGPTAVFTYTGAELSSTIDVTQILTPNAIYDRVDTIGQLNDLLYIGGLHEEPDLDDMQIYALQIKLEWESLLIDAMNPPQEHVQGKKKSLQHEEVYAPYIRYRKTRGGFSKWFHIPGPTPPSFSSTEAATGGLGTVPTYKTDDNIPYHVGFTGGFGPYQNDTETYPDTVDFDLTPFGGENLRKQKVRHHRTPSLRWCKSNLYSGEDDYGRNKLDLLGFRVLNVKIPDKYKDIIDGYEIGYAIRTVSNMTNYGQSIMLHGISEIREQNTPTAQASIYTTGGNYSVQVVEGHGAFGDRSRQLKYLRPDTFRIHPFDVLFNQPSIQPNYISGQFLLQRFNLNDAVTPTPNPNNPPPAKNYVEDGDISGDNTGPLEYIVDFTTGQVPQVQSATNYFRKITSSFYCPNNINVGNFVNGRHETAFCGYLGGDHNWFLNDTTQGMVLNYNNGNTHSNQALGVEQAYFVTLMALKSDIYQNFYNQQITSAGAVINITDTTTPTLWGGDVFISQYTFHTYGRYNSLDEKGDGVKGIKMVRRIVCESISNINLRFVDPANQYSDYWPKSPIVLGNNNNYITLFNRDIDPNQFGYDKSFNALNNLVDSTTWSPFQEYLYDFPYRIHRGGKASRTGRPRSWRTFLALDYYEMIKDKGRIVHLEGMDDRLIIHMENAMFMTQDKSKLEQGLISITLGAGDIFQFEPQESISSKLGYAGTQHDLACVRTPFGYVFVDAKLGEIYIYKQKLSLLNEGLNTFLRDFLKLPDKNSYVGNGITIGWDQRFKRIILTVKNRQLPDGTIIVPFQDTDSFYNSLTPGQIVSYQGRYIQYVGLNTTNYSCPPDQVQQVITWQPVDQYCVKDDNNKNTGIVAYSNRIRLINGVVDGYKEPNTAQGLGTYFQPYANPTICPPTPPVITWQGSGGTCLKNDVTSCAAGFTLSEDGTFCLQTLTQPAIPPSGGSGTPGVAIKVNSEQWNNGGVRYIANYTANGNAVSPSDITLITTPHLFVNGNQPFDTHSRNLVDSRMNVAGIWVDSSTVSGGGDWSPINEFIGFSRKFTVPSARTYLVAIAADNAFKVSVNGKILIDDSADGNIQGAPNFAYANVYPVVLQAGDNYIEMYAMNYGNVAGFFAEVYDTTLQGLQSAQTEADLRILFSTKDMVGQNFDLGITVGYTCPDGWSYDPQQVLCVKINTQAPTTSAGTVNNGNIAWTNRCRYIDGKADGYCEPNTSDGSGQGPYIAPAQNSACIPITPPTPVTYTITGQLYTSCSVADCAANGVTTLTLNRTGGHWPAKFRLLMGFVINRNNTTPQYVGSDIMSGGTPPGGTIPNPDFVTNGANIPLAKDITMDNVLGPVVVNGPITQLNDNSGGLGVWICNDCNMPITDIWIKIDPTSLDPTDPNTYVLSFTSSTFTVHNM